LLLAVALVPLFVGLGNDIQEFDPTQYAEAGRHMAEGGSWLRPRDNFGPYDDKPPMTFWLIALAIKSFGATSFAVRLPSLLAALAAVAATVLIGRELWDRRTGVLAGALLAASPALHLMVADPKIDAVVTAFMAWAVYFFVSARRQPWRVFAAWLCAAGGFLTKGPIAVAVPLLAVLPEALRANWSDQPTIRPLRRVWGLQPVLGPLIVALAFLPYAIAAGPHLVYFHVWEQSFGRITGQSTWHNTAGPFFFLHTALWAFLPFVPALLYALGSRLAALLRARTLPADAARVALWWLVLPLVGISASRYKLPQYLFWLGPPAALLAARAVRESLQTAPRALRDALWVASLVLVVAAAGLTAAVLGRCFPPDSQWKSVGWLALSIAGLFTGSSHDRRRPIRLMASSVLSMTGAMIFFHGHLHPSVLAYQPDHALAERARAEEPNATVLPFVGVMPTNAVGFYARRDARPYSPADFAALVRREGSRAAIVSPEALPQLEAQGLRADVLLDRPSFTTSRPTGAFLLARTRAAVLGRVLLARISVQIPSVQPRTAAGVSP
jgi:4-amino-4-deoxy-L-arabinose transferase-like glycosyltransferase